MSTGSATPTASPHVDSLAHLYRELDVHRKEIRLLILQPGRQDEDLYGSFEYVSLDTPIPYETISYAWGNSFECGAIRVLGHLLDIPKSAEEVLRGVRKVDEVRAVWIDSVCVNQKLRQERQAQVVLMHEIYSLGRQNLIWLGPASESTASAIASIAMLAEEFSDTVQDIDDFESMSGAPLESEIDHAATVEFYESPWFSRLWVVQEAALSPQSICLKGAFEVPFIQVVRCACLLAWSFFFLPSTWLHGPHVLATVMVGFIDGAVETSIQRSGRALFLLLTRLRYFKCSEPRDRVFGAIGLYQKLSTNSRLPRALIPDYEARFEEVWEAACRQAVIEMNDLDCLYFVSPFHEETLTASWVLECTDVADGVTPLALNFEADDRISIVLHCAEDRSGPLILSGFSIDYIQHVRAALWQGRELPSDAKHLLTSIQEIEELIQDEDTLTPESIARLAVTIQGGSDRYQNSADRQQSALAYGRLKSYLRDHDEIPDLQSPEHEDERQISEFTSSAFMHSYGRAVFSTCTGYLGLGAVKTRAGDILAILYGCRCPVILRPISEVEYRYRFISVCYVDGIMNGSLAREHKASDRPDVIFRLE